MPTRVRRFRRSQCDKGQRKSKQVMMSLITATSEICTIYLWARSGSCSTSGTTSSSITRLHQNWTMNKSPTLAFCYPAVSVTRSFTDATVVCLLRSAYLFFSPGLSWRFFKCEAASQFPMCVIGFWFVYWFVRASCVRAALSIVCCVLGCVLCCLVHSLFAGIDQPCLYRQLLDFSLCFLPH